MAELISTYGYVAILVGCFLEGETILVLAGLAAHRGYLDLPLVIVAALAGTFSGDQLFFHIGRRWGPAVVARRPAWKAGIARASRLLETYDTWFILGFRFLYGLRTISPFVVGMSTVKTRRFLALNFVAASIWAVVIGSLGYVLGQALTLVLARIQHYEQEVFAAVAAAGALGWVVHFVRNRRRARDLDRTVDRE